MEILKSNMSKIAEKNFQEKFGNFCQKEKNQLKKI